MSSFIVMGLGNAMSFLKNRYVTPGRDFVAEDYRHSDFGRMYGWWVLLDGLRVASLEYRCFLEEPVHLYSVTALHETFFRIDLDSDKWASPKLSVQSKYASGYSQRGLQMASVGDDLIVVENLFVPENYFNQKHTEVTAFHEKLLVQADRNSKNEQKEEAEEEPQGVSRQQIEADDRIVG